MSNSPIWEYNGESLRVVEWAEKIGINAHCLLHRKDMGWTIEEILSISKDLLVPFKSLREGDIEPSIEVSMLYDTVYLLPYKLECYKSVVNALYKNGGMACDDLTINVFNADCGIDSIATMEFTLHIMNSESWEATPASHF